MNKKLYQDFFELANKKKYGKKDIDLFENAIKYSWKFLKEEKRAKDEAQINHNLRIGKYLIKSLLSREIIIAGLLYKIETKITPKILEKEFGKEISFLVFEQKKVREIKEKANKSNYETLKQILIVSIKDVRILLIKLASKLDNIETIEALEKKEQKAKAKEILDFYAPLASGLGLEEIKKRLIDKSFKILNPKKYKEISDFLKESSIEREETIKKIVYDFEKYLDQKIKNFKIEGREKSIYSINEKIEKRKVPLNQQRDHYAIRIITSNERECYSALLHINKKFENIPNYLKDYIKVPKINGYQSLHTSINLGDKFLEIQIRTEKMHQIAEEGSAAHWQYKKLKSNQQFEIKTSWLKEVLKIQQKKEVRTFLEELKLNLFQDKIYCYTPKGKVIELKKGSTLLDFAYKIHAEIGNKTLGGFINEKFSSLNSELKNGDSIKIITNKFQRPRREWIKFVTSSYAKKIIAKTVKKYENIPISKKTGLLKKEEEKFEIPILVESLPNHQISLAKCCNPLPNKKIKAIVRSYKKILIHEFNCKRTLNSTKNLVSCSWKKLFSSLIKINVESVNRAGILADILNTITRLGFKVKEANAKLVGNYLAECFFILNLENIQELKEIIERINKIKGVRKIWLE